ncbi:MULTISPECIES: RNA-binding S4 domain-containing protein [Lentilactobacillus]|jgi:ribosomal 50S subunit-recycling heat shock protein|uniref:RQC P-site tRNA stabilizing factor n=3 Tax=Lentilactobacillus TaxID=2767893 RepID=J9W918_LENBU|nr:MULTISPECIES: RNA-binding S4 domain-containing protein [Lentilactobacillus]MCC6101726.1 RNA-binding S4 domain-containing protein [Lactobacillus sp.]WCJ52120.1 RNA-binding S4 domain-containing protein [Lentilactobacillus sp. Egmn17]AEB73816.1 RNA-binding S4 domain protein [Lentilactobacillus buchneri NRRL B-30929]AFS00641.1 S4 RNA-binding domain protein [Lentilactobacillus buchneri subsp. silagei CD034]KRK68977.1 RNA-binding S4 domain-containing protein [Lentilactobacillus buchneri DSM 20057
MRIDKFLKVSRIIKRRSVAKEIADKGRIFINGRAAKSSTEVKPNDEVVIKFGNKTLTILVKELLDTTKKDDAERMYEITSEDYERDFRNE